MTKEMTCPLCELSGWQGNHTLAPRAPTPCGQCPSGDVNTVAGEWGQGVMVWEPQRSFTERARLWYLLTLNSLSLVILPLPKYTYLILVGLNQ